MQVDANVDALVMQSSKYMLTTSARAVNLNEIVYFDGQSMAYPTRTCKVD